MDILRTEATLSAALQEEVHLSTQRYLLIMPFPFDLFCPSVGQMVGLSIWHNFL